MAAITKKAMWVNRVPSVAGIRCQPTGPMKARLVFDRTMREPITVCTEEPITEPGVHAFEVVMPVKEGKTAVGFSAEPSELYLTPNHRDDNRYVSHGGAGFTYPAKTHNGGHYEAGDRLRAEIALDTAGIGFVRFQVNGELTGTQLWTHGYPVYPAISCANGEVVCDIDMHDIEEH